MKKTFLLLAIFTNFVLGDIMSEAEQADYGGNKKKALALYEKACYNGNAKACYEAAVLYNSKDATKSFKLVKRSCDLGSPYGCVGLAGSYLIGDKVVSKNYKKAVTFYEKACNKLKGYGQDYACATLAFFYEDGRVTEINKTLAKEYSCKACSIVRNNKKYDIHNCITESRIKEVCENCEELKARGY